MPLQSRPDHVAIVVPVVDDALDRWRDALGGTVQWRFHTPTVFRGAAVQFRGGAFLELLMPSDADQRTRDAGGPAGFVEGFLAKYGAQVHHVTLKVPDFDEALAALEADGFTPVDVNGEDPHWQEAYLRPSEVGGLVVQVAASDRTVEDWAAFNDSPPPVPPEDGAVLLGPLLEHPDLDRAAAVWAALGADVDQGEDGLVASWPGEALTVAVRHGDAAGAVGLRFAGTSPRPADPRLGPTVLARA